MAPGQVRSPSIAVIGLGDYYSKLCRSVWKYFEPIALIDDDPSAAQRLSDDERRLFHRLDRGERLSSLIGRADIVMILTPNDTHPYFAVELSKSRKPLVIEKPIATTSDGLAALGALVQSRLPLYFSDFYVDVRATPLLLTAHRLRPGDWRRELVRGDLASNPSIDDIGPISRVHGRIFEEYPFRDDSWLGRSISGGVIFDLMIHLLALIGFLFPDNDLQIRKCERLFLHSSSVPSHYFETPPTAEAGEAFAQVEAVLLPSKIQVFLEVAKSAQHQDRHLTIEGTAGLLSQRFEPNHPLRLVTDTKDAALTLVGDRYEMTSRAIRHWYDTAAQTYGWEWNSWAAEKAIEVRNRRPPKLTTVRSALPVKNSSLARIPTKSSRREFLLLAGTFLAASVSAVHDMHGEYVHFRDSRNAITSDLAQAAGQSEKWLDSGRLTTISKLLGTYDRLVLAPGTEHEYGEPTWEASLHGYPHDQRALAPFRYLAWSQVEVLDVDGFPGLVQPGDVVVATGSPTSSGLARLLMGRDSIFQAGLPYRIEEIADRRFITVRSGMEGGHETDKKAKQLVNASGVCYTDLDHIDNSRRLIRDVLLVSRVPWITDEADVLLFSGFHGAGTQAAELLFRKEILSEKDLQALCAFLGRGRYWQFVLEVNDLSDEPSGLSGCGNMTTAHSIRLSQRCPPLIFTPAGRNQRSAAV